MSELPAHIGIIMDGNGRWAKKRLLPRTAGHAKGAEVFQTITRHCQKRGIKALTVYAFSTENWSRPEGEVRSIMNLLRRYLDDAFGFKDENIRIKFIGERDRLERDIVDKMAEIEDFSKGNDELLLNIAVNYGGRDEITAAARALCRDAVDGRIIPESVDEKLFESYLFTSDCPPLDLVLRPSGEQRLSNFLLWQCAYSEFVFMDVLWPDFTPDDLDRALDEYSARKRRFGGVG